MKKLFLLFVLVLLSSTVLAQIPLMTSADQYYSVVFDEEGEAMVSLNIILTNAESTPINSVVLEIPGQYVNVLGVVQETSGDVRRCISWDTDCVEYGAGQTCVLYDFRGDCRQYERPCLKTGKVCSSYVTDYVSYPTYERIEVNPLKLSNSVSVPITLIDSVDTNEQTTLLLLYKVEGYVGKTVNYKFDFETAKLAFATNKVRVAVNVQDGLFIKGGDTKVNYQSNFAGLSKMMAEPADMGMRSDYISGYRNEIMYARGLVKTASYLDPYESFTVSGKYSGSRISLYFGWILFVLLIILAVIGFIVNGVRKLKAHSKKQAQKHRFMIPFLTGFLSAVGISFLWIIALIMVQVFNDFISYGVGDLFGLLIVLITILLTLAIMIGVPIWAGNKYGGWTGGLTVVFMLGWLFIVLMVIFFVFGLLFTRNVMYMI